MMKPLEGVRVVDFSALVPGPFASLVLADAGAEVIKVERPGDGDDMRRFPDEFAKINRGKACVFVDLKDPASLVGIRPLLEGADVLLEQFRPGVMERLGLGYEAVRAINPRIVYCSVTGYGQTGSLAGKAAHDLNYLADAGLLSTANRENGLPHLPPTMIADIGAGSLPAVINILLGLRLAERSGQGMHLDIAMTDSLFGWHWWSGTLYDRQGSAEGGGSLGPARGAPRYNVYLTADRAILAVGAVEEKFWQRFCDIIDLPMDLRGPGADQIEVGASVARIIAEKNAESWRALFDGTDTCVSVVASVDEAFEHPHFRTRGLFDATVAAEGGPLHAIATPLAPVFRPRGEAHSPLDMEEAVPRFSAQGV